MFHQLVSISLCMALGVSSGLELPVRSFKAPDAPFASSYIEHDSLWLQPRWLIDEELVFGSESAESISAPEEGASKSDFDATQVAVPVADRNYDCGWSFARNVSAGEARSRLRVVEAAQMWLGCNELDGSFEEIIDIYNTYRPVPRNTVMHYGGEWCSAYASAVAIKLGLTEIIPVECGCFWHIELFKELGGWQEDDDYVPLPGDYIFYHWDCTAKDCTHDPSHVGIVVGVLQNMILVIEGNYRERVQYRIVTVGDYRIRGYGVPAYSTVTAKSLKEIASESLVLNVKTCLDFLNNQ